MLCVTNNSIKYQSFVYTKLNDQAVLFQTIYFDKSTPFFLHIIKCKTVLFQTIQFSKSKQLSSIWAIDSNLSDATTLCQSGPWSNGNEGVFRFTKAPLLMYHRNYLVSYPGRSLWESYPSTVMQSVYSTAPADLATGHSLRVSYPRCRDAVGVFYSFSTNWAKLLGGILLLCWDAVGVLNNSRRPGYRTFAQIVLSLCRDTVGIWYSLQPTGTTTLWGWYHSADMQSVYSTPPTVLWTRKYLLYLMKYTLSIQENSSLEVFLCSFGASNISVWESLTMWPWG